MNAYVLAVGIALCAASISASPDFERLPCNNPDSVVWLKGGFATVSLHVLDFDGDGDLDLVTESGFGHYPWVGHYLFRNPAGKGVPATDPVFPKAERIDPAVLPKLPLAKYADGTTVEDVFWPCIKKGFLGRHKSYDMRQLKDMDGDGVADLVVSVAERDHDAWQNRYDEAGNWTAVQMRGFVYWLKGLGGSTYARAKMMYLENAQPLEVYGQPSTVAEDYDGDGDIDLIVFDFKDTITYFENIAGVRKDPVYTSGRFLRGPDGRRVHGDLCMPCAVSADWDRDGRPDIVFGEEDARIAWLRNTGTIRDGMPVFDPPRYFRQQADELCFGSLACPWAADLDGDGDEDIVCGNAAGQIAFIENLSGAGVAKPKWAPPTLIREPDGHAIWIQAGAHGSIQGPCESKWGYVSLSVADWDHDGQLDIMANTISGEVWWWRNIGTRSVPQFDFARRVAVEWDGEQPELAWGWMKPRLQENPNHLLTQWRTTPVMTDFNRDGLTDLVMLDQSGVLAFFERFRRQDGTLAVRSPRRALLWHDGKPMKISCGFLNGVGCGRRKICVCDWDGDGRLDVIVNGARNACVYRQVDEKDGNWYFRSVGEVAVCDLATHDPQPAVCDFNADGSPDLLFGAMDGFIYHFENSRADQERKESE